MSSATDRGYIQHKARPAALAVCKNLCELERNPKPLATERHWPGHVAIIFGAGPSGAQHLDDIRYRMISGRTPPVLYTVNTAAPALRAAEMHPSVLVVRETIDVSVHLDGVDEGRTEVVADLSAAPKVFERAASFFVAGGTQYLEIAAALGVEPVFGGTSALTGAVALAQRRGASTIVLIGADLAIAPDGALYADGSMFAGARASVADGRAELSGEGVEVEARIATAGGFNPWPTTQTVETVAGSDGSPRHALGPWVDQIRWLSTFASRHPEIGLFRVGHGAALNGWRQCGSLDEVRGHASETKRAALDPERVSRALALLRSQCDTAKALAAEMVEGEGRAADVSRILAGSPLVELAHAAWAESVHQRRLDPAPSVEAFYQLLQLAAEEVREALDT